jgi:single-strand DNA-binding protein
MSKAIVIVTGNLGGDPDLQYTPSGSAVCKFSIAVNDRIGSGENAKELTTWYRVAAWGKQGESAAKNLVKGRQVQVTGRLVQDTYTDKDGAARTSLEVNAFDITFVGAKPDAQNGGGGGGAKPASKTTKPASGKKGDGDIEDDEIPF